jgi:hypothetical protein
MRSVLGADTLRVKQRLKAGFGLRRQRPKVICTPLARPYAPRRQPSALQLRKTGVCSRRLRMKLQAILAAFGLAFLLTGCDESSALSELRIDPLPAGVADPCPGAREFLRYGGTIGDAERMIVGSGWR